MAGAARRDAGRPSRTHRRWAAERPSLRPVRPAMSEDQRESLRELMRRVDEVRGLSGRSEGRVALDPGDADALRATLGELVEELERQPSPPDRDQRAARLAARGREQHGEHGGRGRDHAHRDPLPGARLRLHGGVPAAPRPREGAARGHLDARRPRPRRDPRAARAGGAGRHRPRAVAQPHGRAPRRRSATRRPCCPTGTRSRRPSRPSGPW